MLSFKDYVLNTWNLEMPQGNISSDWFQDNRIPMVVRCTHCGMTMASPSAWIDDEGYTYCSDCAGVNKEE